METKSSAASPKEGQMKDRLAIGELRRRWFVGGLLAFTAASALLAGSGLALAADPPAREAALRLDVISGTNVKRVTLAPKAVERLGIELGAVREETIVRKQMVGGEIVTVPRQVPVAQAPAGPSMGGAVFRPATAPASSAATAQVVDVGGTWIRVALSERELAKIAQDAPSRVLPLLGRAGVGVPAQPSKMPVITDPRRASVVLHYIVDEKVQGLQVGQRVRVELPLAGSAARLKVVPYGAVLYDAQGQGWVYTNPEANVFVRQKVDIEDIENDLAILSSGPATGTSVVTVGAMLLYGAETQGK
jgi:hypothetical protein